MFPPHRLSVLLKMKGGGFYPDGEDLEGAYDPMDF